MVNSARIRMKVSKKVRKKVRKAVESAASPFVRDFATAAMAAAGRARRESNGNEGKAHIMCGETRVHIDGSKVAEAFRAAAINGLRTFFEGLEEGLRKAQAEGDDPQPKPRAKPGAKSKPKAGAKAKARPKPAAAPKAKRAARKPRASGGSPGPGAPGA